MLKIISEGQKRYKTCHEHELSCFSYLVKTRCKFCKANGALLTESQCSKTNGSISGFSSKIQCLNYMAEGVETAWHFFQMLESLVILAPEVAIQLFKALFPVSVYMSELCEHLHSFFFRFCN